MKKLAFLFVCLCILLVGCQEKEYVFPEDAVIGGVSVGGQTSAMAEQLLKNAAAGYTLQVDLEGRTIVLNAQNLGLSYVGGTPTEALIGAKPQDVFKIAPTVDVNNLIIEKKQDTPASLSPISYSEEQECFVPGDVIPGIHYDYSGIGEQILAAAAKMEPKASVKPEETPNMEGAADQQTAVDAANRYLTLELTYVFDYPIYDGADTQDVYREDILSFLEVSEDGMSVTVSKDAVRSYAEALSDWYSVGGSSGECFITHDGDTVVLESPEGNGWVDVDFLTEDLYTCVTEGISGTRDAKYLPEGSGPMEVVDFGTYVEVDLKNQMVYCYEDGELKVETPCVSGCVASGDETPTGLYYFYHMDRDAWLEGPTWLDWVDCWMAFYGGYGMHDANWRDEFGGDIYLENGSHGCVNLPPENAPLIYEIIDIGDAIILY